MRGRALLAIASWLLGAGAAAADGPRLLLAGGALPVCSNIAPQACVAGRVPGPLPLAAQYRLDAAGIERVVAGWWHPHRTHAHKRIVAALRRWLARAGVIDFSVDALPAALGRGARAAGAWTDLAEFERARVLDALERAPVTERVAFAESTTDSGAAIFREFVAMARQVSGRQQPRVLVSTASSRDPHAAIDFYLALFTQAGAQVRWLPLDHALRAAQSDPAQACGRLDRLRGERWGAQDRARLHPARAAELEAACRDSGRLREALDWADAVFLNGGDQSFTRAAWFAADGATPSAELLQLRQRIAAGTLVLGGTSAGTAVQSASPGVMLVSGPALPTGAAQPLSQLPPDPDCRAAAACENVDPDALLLHPGGGLGSFPLGVLDTHFSERGREYRLARLLLDSGVALGVGIDENTALRLDRVDGEWRARVIGRAGVTLLRRLDDHRLLWSRQVSGVDFTWPGAGAASPCEAPVAHARTLRADSTDLRDALQAADQRHASPWRLESAGRLQPAGQACAGDAPGERVWEFLAPTAAPELIGTADRHHLRQDNNRHE